AVAFAPARVKGGEASTGTVTLEAAPVADLTVRLSIAAGGSVVSSLPATVTIPAGSTSAPFTLATRSATTLTTVQISATTDQGAATGSLDVQTGRQTALQRLRFAAPSVGKGQKVQLEITLADSHPNTDVVVSLTSSNPTALPAPALV